MCGIVGSSNGSVWMQMRPLEGVAIMWDCCKVGVFNTWKGEFIISVVIKDLETHQ